MDHFPRSEKCEVHLVEGCRRKPVRTDLPNELILEKISQGLSIREIARQFNCSWSLIHKASRGRRRDPNRIVKNLPMVKDGEKPCARCGMAPVKPGNRFLCEYCFSNANSFPEI